MVLTKKDKENNVKALTEVEARRMVKNYSSRLQFEVSLELALRKKGKRKLYKTPSNYYIFKK